jgi:hypothetical protein
VSALQKLLSTFWSFSSIFLSFKGIVMHILFAGSDNCAVVLTLI